MPSVQLKLVSSSNFLDGFLWCLQMLHQNSHQYHHWLYSIIILTICTTITISITIAMTDYISARYHSQSHRQEFFIQKYCLLLSWLFLHPKKNNPAWDFPLFSFLLCPSPFQTTNEDWPFKALSQDLTWIKKQTLLLWNSTQRLKCDHKGKVYFIRVNFWKLVLSNQVHKIQ